MIEKSSGHNSANMGSKLVHRGKKLILYQIMQFRLCIDTYINNGDIQVLNYQLYYIFLYYLIVI